MIFQDFIQNLPFYGAVVKTNTHTDVRSWHFPLNFFCLVDVITSGHSSVSPDETLLCVTNLIDGSDLYSMPSLQWLRTFPQEVTLNYPIQGSLALDGVFVTGSDNGTVNIYDILSGHRLWSLPHAVGNTPICHNNSQI